MADDVERRFRSVLERRGWLDPGPTLLAVSGGSDSMALLRLFCRAVGPSRVAVAHVDHCLRPESMDDALFVRRRCDDLGVRCFAARLDVGGSVRRGESLEATGRRLRYSFFEDCAARLGCRYVALGHTRNDLAESVLLNAARGCGLWGLAGMPACRGKVIRPLLSFYREELRSYLRSAGWSWIEDSSNGSDEYQRNRVRHHVMPALEGLVNSRAAEHLASLAEEGWEWRAFVDDLSERNFRACAVGFHGWPALSLRRLRRLERFERVELLRWLGRQLGLRPLSRRRCEELDRLAVSSGRWVFQWGSEVDVSARDGLLILSPAVEKRLIGAELWEGRPLRWGGWRLSLRRLDPGGASGDASDAAANSLSGAVPDDASGGAPSALSGVASGVAPVPPLALLEWALACRVVFSRPVCVARGGGEEFFFPRLGQDGVFSAERKQNGWDLAPDSVEYTGDALILFSPLAGRWRNDLWS